MSQLRILLALTALAALSASPAERWRMQYFHDADDSQLVIADLQFPTPQRGMAVGYLLEHGKRKPAGLVTTNGGRTWTAVQVPKPVVSAFFLNESLGWIVTQDGTVWRTTEFGRDWVALKRLRGALRVYFRDASHGWALGLRKSIWETSDGGNEWRPLPAASQPKTTPDYTVYSCIAFANPMAGMIVGWSKPPRPSLRPHALPDWLNPDTRPREWPSMIVMLETRDGGARWTVSESSIFGRVTRLRMAPNGRALGVIEFLDAFDWPSEVIYIDLLTGKSRRVFRRKDRVVTDAALPAKGPAYLATVEAAGTLARTPVPGKLKLYRSDNLSDWQEMEVDYRAVAQRAVLAAPDAASVWVATDTGMILKLVSE
jgi:hypothetical protein